MLITSLQAGDVNPPAALPSGAMATVPPLTAPAAPMLPLRIPGATIDPSPDVLLPLPPGTPVTAVDAVFYEQMVNAFGDPAVPSAERAVAVHPAPAGCRATPGTRPTAAVVRSAGRARQPLVRTKRRRRTRRRSRR